MRVWPFSSDLENSQNHSSKPAKYLGNYQILGEKDYIFEKFFSKCIPNSNLFFM